MNKNIYKVLIGKVVKDVWIEKDYQEDCVLETDDGFYRIVLEADCCSESFVGDVLKADKGKVIDVEELEIIEGEVPDRKSRQEEDEVFGIKLIMDDKVSQFGNRSQSVILVFRNASNGYYGGSVRSIKKIDDFESGEYIKITRTPKSFF